MNDSGWRKRQIALDEKAENASELGLDYEPNKTIIEMARDALIVPFFLKATNDEQIVRLKDFEALVRADERNKTWTQEHWTEYERSIAAAEREACAKFCETNQVWVGRGKRGFTELGEDEFVNGGIHQGMDYAAAIRARGQA